MQLDESPNTFFQRQHEGKANVQNRVTAIEGQLALPDRPADIAVFESLDNGAACYPIRDFRKVLRQTAPQQGSCPIFVRRTTEIPQVLGRRQYVGQWPAFLGAVRVQPTSSNAIMQRACPYCGENSEPGRHITESLTSTPRVREQPRVLADIGAVLMRRPLGFGQQNLVARPHGPRVQIRWNYWRGVGCRAPSTDRGERPSTKAGLHL